MKTTRCGRFRFNWKNAIWFIVLTENQISLKYRYIEKLPTITELVISSYPAISQQFWGFKNIHLLEIDQVLKRIENLWYIA